MTPGERIDGRYELLRKVGDGAAGEVWHALDGTLKEEVALKLAMPHLSLHARFRARFAREVAIGASLSHPNLVPIRDTGALPDGRPWVAMGYASGGTLADLLADPSLAPDVRQAVALHVVAQVLDGVAAVHAHGMVHQDLKPENILLQPGSDGLPVAWIADLGVADGVADVTREAGAMVGTPTWMAPEQLAGRVAELGPATDLYAVGLMLWQVCFGDVPAPSTRCTTRPRPPAGADVDVALQSVLDALLAPDPHARPDCAADAARALRAALRGEHALILDDASVAPFWARVTPTQLPPEPPPDEGHGRTGATLSPRALALAPRDAAEFPEARARCWEAARTVQETRAPRAVLLVGGTAPQRVSIARRTARDLAIGGWMECVTLTYRAPVAPDDGYRGAVRGLLAPWLEERDQLIDRLARWIARDRRLEASACLEEAERLARWCGHLGESDAGVRDSVALRYLHAHLRARAWRGGVCVVLEEAHVAQGDGEGLQMALSLLEPSAGPPPVLVVVTLSEESLAQPSEIGARVRALEELGARTIHVDGATAPPVTGSLAPELADVLAEARVTHGLQDVVVLRTWAARGLLEADRARGCLRLRAGIDLADALPPDAQTLAQRRIRAALQQCPDPRAAADALALVALAGSAPPTVMVRSLEDGGVDALIASGLVVPEDGTLCFEHPDVESAARDEAEARADVAQAHKRLADAWTGYARRTGVDVRPQLGLHLLRAGSPAEALHPLLWSVRALLEGGRAREGLRTAALAVEAADATGHLSSAITARRLHAEALVELGDTERATALARFALAQASQIADTSSALLLRVLLARAHRKGGNVEAAQRELDAVADVCAPGTPVDRAQLAQRARMLRARGEHLAAARAWGAMLPAAIVTPTARGARGAPPAPLAQDPSALAETVSAWVESLLRGGDVATAQRHLDTVTACAEGTDDLRRAPEAMGVLAMRELLVGDSARATRLLHDAVRQASTCGVESLTMRLRLLLATAARRAAMPAVAWTAATDALRTATARGHTLAQATARLERALAAHADGRTDAVVTETDAAAEALAHAPRHALWLYVSVLRACSAVGERAFETRWTIVRARGLPDSGAPLDLHPALAWLEGQLRDLGDDTTADAVATARATPRAPELLGLLGGA